MVSTTMDTAKVFKTGRSMAVRLPRAYRFPKGEVAINRVGEMVVLYPMAKGWRLLAESLARFTPDYMAERKQPTGSDPRPRR